VGKWLTKLWQAEDAALNDSLKFYGLSVIENSVECEELFITGMS
jgi:hypothetical protein